LRLTSFVYVRFSLLVLVTKSFRVGLLTTRHCHGDSLLLRDFVHRLFHRALLGVVALERRQFIAGCVLLGLFGSLVIGAAGTLTGRRRVYFRRDGLDFAAGNDLTLNILERLMLRNTAAKSLGIYLLLGTKRAHWTDA